jgi:hypothetical protein
MVIKMEIPVRALGLIADIIQSAGFEVTYAYDDLVFSSQNVFIFRFTDTASEVELFFNKDCDKETEKKLKQTLNFAAKNKGLHIIKYGHYDVSQTGDENISIEFF